MTDACIVCRKHEPRGYTCDACRNRIRNNLTDIVELTALAATWAPTSSGDDGSARGKPGSRPPCDLTALDDALGIDALGTLESWERVIREDFGLVPYGVATEAAGASLTQCVGFLLHWLERLCDSWPAVDEFAREVRDVRGRLTRYDETAERGTMRIPCPTPDDHGGECGMHLSVSPSDLSRVVTCRRCGESWNVDRLLLVALSDPELALRMDPDAASYATGIDVMTLRRWATTGRISVRHGRYDLAEIRQAREVAS
jgi:hypothetical protein